MIKKTWQVVSLVVKTMAKAGKLESQAYYVASKRSKK